ncbi:MAG: hypothetical protein JST06_02730 [Bacteroidetes bacterium]|nr:hypothetical protein [Bacteroidota bacterium]
MKTKGWLLGLVLLLCLLSFGDAQAHCGHWRYRHFRPRRVWVAPPVVVPRVYAYHYFRPRFYRPHPWRWHHGYRRF